MKITTSDFDFFLFFKKAIYMKLDIQELHLDARLGVMYMGLIRRDQKGHTPSQMEGAKFMGFSSNS